MVPERFPPCYCTATKLVTQAAGHSPMATDIVRVGRALLSVSDKSGPRRSRRARSPTRGVELVSTGGTAAALSRRGLAVVDVAQLTGFPEMMDGRLKTLHPRVHGGLLAIRAEPAHQAAMIANDIAPIDLLVVNLYPFEATLRARRLVRRHDREHRHRRPGDDPRRGQEPRRRRRDRRCRRLSRAARGIAAARRRRRSLAFRRRMAQKAYARTAAYDAAISNWLARETRRDRAEVARLRRQARFSALRYGENPHQRAAFYARPPRRAPGVATARQVQGKELSYNNINDTDAAYELRRRVRSRRTRRSRDHQARQPLRRRARRDARRGLREGARLRSRLGLRRRRRAQPAARRGERRARSSRSSPR